MGLPLSSGLACYLAVQMVGHSPPVDLASAVASLLLKVTRGQRKEGQDMGQRSSSAKEREVALGHLAMSCFCPNNPSSLLQPTEGSKVNSQDCCKSEIIFNVMGHDTTSLVTNNITLLRKKRKHSWQGLVHTNLGCPLVPSLQRLVLPQHCSTLK